MRNAWLVQTGERGRVLDYSPSQAEVKRLLATVPVQTLSKDMQAYNTHSQCVPCSAVVSRRIVGGKTVIRRRNY